MATKKSTRATSRKPTPGPTAAVRAAVNPIPALRKFQAMLAEDLGFDFLSARSAVMTAILALEGKGVETHIAMSLRVHVLRPLDRIEKLATNREAQS